jgi:HEPN domain-containing protein
MGGWCSRRSREAFWTKGPVSYIVKKAGVSSERPIMINEEKYATWMQYAQYDLDTADAMYSTGRWFYVAYMCQQALEKLCKGLYTFYIDDDVPKVNDIRKVLTAIEDTLSITIQPDVYKLADLLSGLYLNNRYPDFAGQSTIQIDKTTATALLEKTKEAFTWLLTLKK